MLFPPLLYVCSLGDHLDGGAHETLDHHHEADYLHDYPDSLGNNDHGDHDHDHEDGFNHDVYHEDDIQAPRKPPDEFLHYHEFCMI